MTAWSETSEKERFSASFPHRHGDATGKPAARDKTRKIHGCRKTSTPALPTRLPPIFTVDFRLSISNLAYSEPGSPFPDCRGINWPLVQLSVAPGYRARDRSEEGRRHNHWADTGPAIFTVVNVTKKKDEFCSFPDWHGEATGKWPETRQVGAPERGFRARLPPTVTLSSLNIDVSCEASNHFQNIAQKNATPAGICTLSPLDAALPTRFAINTQHDTSKGLSVIDQQPGLLWAWLSVSGLQRGINWPPVQLSVAPGYRAQDRSEEGRRHNHCACHEKWRWTTSKKWCACHEKNATHLLKNVAKSIAPATQKTTFDTLQEARLNVTKCHACHAKRSNETYHRHGHMVLKRTVANGCETAATTNATSSEHTPNPQTPRVKREPFLRYAFGKNGENHERECFCSKKNWCKHRENQQTITKVLKNVQNTV